MRTTINELLSSCFATAILFSPSIGNALEKFGAWTVGVNDASDSIYATTLNSAGSALGQYCMPENGGCMWIIAVKTRCKEGDSYPVILNSDVGSAPLYIVCDGIVRQGLTQYHFSSYWDADAFITKALNVGLAFPLSDGRFQVERFDMEGSVKAIATMKDAVQRVINKRRNDSKASYDKFL